MKVKSIIVAGAIALAMTTGGSLAVAGKGKTNADTQAKGSTTQAEAVARLDMANGLIVYGDANKDALSLIVAARILKENPVRPIDAKKETEGKAKAAGSKSAEAADNSVEGVLARAKQYAAGRKDVIALADDVAATSSRGKVNGPAQNSDRVLAGATDTWPISFRGGELAQVAIRGDGDTDLDFYVYDGAGHLITSDTDSTDYALLSWTPAWTGIFRIKVVNRGGVYNNYAIGTN